MDRVITEFKALFDESFFNNTWDRDYRHYSQVITEPEILFNWNTLNHLVEAHARDYPRWALAKNKKYIPLKELVVQAEEGKFSCPDFLKIREYIKAGATLIFNNAEISTPSLRKACQNLFQVFQEDVLVNVYASFGNEPGFGLHYDDMDTIILQITGSKHWSLYGKLKETPPPREMRSVFYKNPPQEKRLEIDLQAGDVLYLPAGYWHDVVSTDSPSLHLTFSVCNRTGMDFLHYLMKKIAHEPCVLSAISKRSKNQQDALAFTILELFKKHISGEGLEGFLQEHTQRQPFFAPLGLPFSVLKDPFNTHSIQETDIVSLICSSWSDWQENPDGKTTFCALGKEWTFAQKYKPVLSTLLKKARLTVRDLMTLNPHLKSPDLFSFLEKHVREGLLTLEAS